MNRVRIEERPVVPATPINATFGVFATNPIELFVEADDDLVEEGIFEVFVVGAIDGGLGADHLVETFQGLGQLVHHVHGSQDGARSDPIAQQRGHVVLGVQVEGFLEVQLFVGHAWQLLSTSSMFLPFMSPEIEFVSTTSTNICPFRTKLGKEIADLFRVKLVCSVAVEGADLIVGCWPYPMDCPLCGRIVNGARVLVASVLPSQATGDWPNLSEHKEIKVVSFFQFNVFWSTVLADASFEQERNPED